MFAAERAATDSVGLIFALLAADTERKMINHPQGSGALRDERVLQNSPQLAQ